MISDLLQNIKDISQRILHGSQRDLWSRTFFSEDIITEKQYQIALSATLPLSNQRDLDTTQNGATITDNGNATISGAVTIKEFF